MTAILAVTSLGIASAIVIRLAPTCAAPTVALVVLAVLVVELSVANGAPLATIVLTVESTAVACALASGMILIVVRPLDPPVA